MDSILHRKKSIIFTTIDVINEFGIQGVSTREVAKRAGISEGTIFKHFNTKKDLFLAVLDYYSQFDNDIFSTVLLKYNNFRDSITFFIKSYIEYYENYPAVTSIMQSYDVLNSDPVLGERIKEIFYNRIKFVERLIKEAQKRGEIKSQVNAEELSVIILGTMRTICLKWRLENYNFQLKNVSMGTLNTIIDAYCAI